MLHGAASNAGVGGHEGLVDCVSHDGLVDALGELRESHDGHARDSVLGLLDDPIENPTLVESRRELLDDPIEGPTAARCQCMRSWPGDLCRIPLAELWVMWMEATWTTPFKRCGMTDPGEGVSAQMAAITDEGHLDDSFH